MFLGMSITKSTGNYSEQIKRLKDKLKTSDTIVFRKPDLTRKGCFIHRGITDCFSVVSHAVMKLLKMRKRSVR